MNPPGTFAVIAGQREEIHADARRTGRDGVQHHRLAIGGENGGGGLLGEIPCFED
jgi:hypothetical protein